MIFGHVAAPLYMYVPHLFATSSVNKSVQSKSGYHMVIL